MFVSSCLADLLGKGFWLFSVQHQCPKWWWRSYPRALNSNSQGGPHHPRGLYSTEAHDSETHPRHHGPPVQVTSPIKDSDESFIQPYGWERTCLINPRERQRMKSDPCHFHLKWEE